MHNRNGCGKRRGNTPLEGENIPDQDVVAIATNRMFPKVRKYCVSEGSANQLSESKQEQVHKILYYLIDIKNQFLINVYF